MAFTFEEGGRERILEQGMALAGTEERARAERLLEGLCAMSAAMCGREHFSRQMEGILAVLLSRRLSGEGDRAVSSVKRGDTTIVYEDSGGSGADMARLLAPFIHLRSPKGRWRR